MVLTMKLFSGHHWKNSHREQTCGHGERGGDGEMYGESDMETYITMCRKEANGHFLCISGNSNRGSVST